MVFRAFLGFAPFAAFALIEKLIDIVPGLAAGLATSLALVAWEMIGRRRINILETGSALIFGVLTALAVHRHQAWSIWQIRLYVDAGLAGVVLVSVALRRPFTLQSGQERVSPEVTRSQDFLRHNMTLSAAWGGAFAGLAAVDLMMTAWPETPDRRGILLTLTILAAAAKFTQSYVKRIRAQDNLLKTLTPRVESNVEHPPSNLQP